MRFLVAILDHAYWIIGSIIGAFIGGVLPFDTTGIDLCDDQPVHGHFRRAVAGVESHVSGVSRSGAAA